MDIETLERAAQRGIISHKQLQELIAFSTAQDNDEPTSEEQLRFIRNFGDIFITLGVLFVAFSIAAMHLSQLQWLLPAALFLGAAEWLVRVRRLALPGIAILISTLYFLSKALGVSQFETATLQFLTLSVCSLLFYLRYRMPFSLLPVAAGLVAATVSSVGIDMFRHQLLFTAMGLIVFLVAMSFDAQDRKRQRSAGDCGFWLHLLASPLIVHGMMTTLLFSHAGVLDAGSNREIALLLFFILFLLTALFVDRRAMLVSSLSYAIYAIFKVVSSNILDSNNLPLVIFIGFGVFIVLFGTYWYKLRRLIFGPLRGSWPARFVPEI
ncbi:hypothetical protein SAMN03080615_01438 [Amphritea atlantica]|uniref:DUF2157 domain-containing protein n=1 Tax=Amphritea atlantica TaxID=355243 RepID=A0A1H9FV29_9GAMM|nr:hypothetical protein [Amphritea atlantica]SEQ41348.1 hypothetical protein SAMN03080615_01438 [Amphritea atlantica]